VIVPRGKKVEISVDAAPLAGTEGVELLLDEPLTLKFQSQFQDLISGGAPDAINVLGSVMRDVAGFGFSGQFKQFGFQVWKKTEPLVASITIALNMKTNAYDDVVAPALALVKLPLPTEGERAGNLIPPGPSVLEAFGDNSGSRGRRMTVRLGFVTLQNVIVDSAEPTFSKECDQNGYPIWGKVVLNIRTIFTATTQMVDDILTGEEV